MNAIRCRSIRIGVFAFFAALGIAFLAAEQVQAQPGLGGMRRGGQPKKGGSTGGGQRPPKDDTKWKDTGEGECRILDFEQLKEGGDAEVIGVLRVRPLAKKAKTLKLLVRKTEDLQIRFDQGDGTLDLEMLSTLPLKNVLCNASWGDPQRDSGDDSGDKDKKKKSDGDKVRELRSLTLKTVEVEGKIVSMEGDTITIKAKPTGDKQWPDIEAKQADQPEKKGNTKAPRIVQRKLKLRLIDDVTKFLAGNEGSLELGDFKEDQDVEAYVVCGSKEGVMVVLRAPGVEGAKKIEEPQKPGPRPPPDGREGTRRPGGVKKGGGI